MKNIFNSKEEYVAFITEWKQFVKSGGTKNSPHAYMIYNVLKGRDKLHGFNNIKGCTLHHIAGRLSFERLVLGYNDNRSIIKKLLNIESTPPADVIDYLKNLAHEIHELGDEK